MFIHYSSWSNLLSTHDIPQNNLLYVQRLGKMSRVMLPLALWIVQRPTLLLYIAARNCGPC